MGTLEHESRRRTKRGQLERIVLSSLVVAGVVTVAIAAPGAVRLLKYIDPEWLLKPDPQQRLRETASKLRKKGLVTFVLEGGRKRMRITKKGRQYLEHMSLSGAPIRPKKWDGKWRLVMFDIPEKRAGVRQRVRTLVTGFGFQRLQDSVWVFPYDCEDVIALLKTQLKIGTEVLYVIADAIEYDAPIRKRFDLPSAT